MCWFKVGAAQGWTAGINGVLLCMLRCWVAKWINSWSWCGDWGLLVKGLKYLSPVVDALGWYCKSIWLPNLTFSLLAKYAAALRHTLLVYRMQLWCHLGSCHTCNPGSKRLVTGLIEEKRSHLPDSMASLPYWSSPKVSLDSKIFLKNPRRCKSGNFNMDDWKE